MVTKETTTSGQEQKVGGQEGGGDAKETTSVEHASGFDLFLPSFPETITKQELVQVREQIQRLLESQMNRLNTVLGNGDFLLELDAEFLSSFQADNREDGELLSKTKADAEALLAMKSKGRRAKQSQKQKKKEELIRHKSRIKRLEKKFLDKRGNKEKKPLTISLVDLKDHLNYVSLEELVKALYLYLISFIVWNKNASLDEIQAEVVELNKLLGWAVKTLDVGTFLGLSALFSKDGMIANHIDTITMLFQRLGFIYKLDNLNTFVSSYFRVVPFGRFGTELASGDENIERNVTDMLNVDRLSQSYPFAFLPHDVIRLPEKSMSYALLFDFLVKAWLKRNEGIFNEKFKKTPKNVTFAVVPEPEVDGEIIIKHSQADLVSILFYPNELEVAGISNQVNVEIVSEALLVYTTFPPQVLPEYSDIVRLPLYSPVRQLDALFHALVPEELLSWKLNQQHLDRARSGTIGIDERGEKYVFSLKKDEFLYGNLGLRFIEFKSPNESDQQLTVKIGFVGFEIEFYLDDNLEIVGLDQASEVLKSWIKVLTIFYLGEAKNRSIQVKEENKPKDSTKHKSEVDNPPHLRVLPLRKGPFHNNMWFSSEWNESNTRRYFGFGLLELNAVILQMQITYYEQQLWSLDELTKKFYTTNSQSEVNMSCDDIFLQAKKVLKERLNLDGSVWDRLKGTSLTLFERILLATNSSRSILGVHKAQETLDLYEVSWDVATADQFKGIAREAGFYMVTFVDSRPRSDNPRLFDVSSERKKTLIGK